MPNDMEDAARQYFDSLQDGRDVYTANNRIKEDGGNPIEGSSPATAAAIMVTPNPSTHQGTFEQMAIHERVFNAGMGGVNMGLTNFAAAKIDVYRGLREAGVSSVYETDSDSFDTDANDQIENMLLDPNNAAYKQFDAKQKANILEAENDYFRRSAQQAQYPVPEVVQRAEAETEGMDLLPGLKKSLSILAEDPLNAMIYLGASSVGQQVPATAVTIASAPFGLAPIVAPIAYGVNSYTNEYGSRFVDKAKKAGYTLTTHEDWDKLYANKAFIEDTRYQVANASTVVGALDSMSGWAKTISLFPGDAVRNTLKVATGEVPGFGVRFSKSMANYGFQQGIDATLGGAGEALGALVSGEEVNPAAVLFEMVGGMHEAVSETFTIGLAQSRAYRNDVEIAKNAKMSEERLQKIADVTEAASADLKNGEAIDAWAERIGHDKNLYMLGQDVIDAGTLDKIRQVDETLANAIEQAAKEAGTVNVPVSKIVQIAAVDRELANELIKDGRVTVDGMSPRQADKFMSEDKKEVERQFDRAIRGTKASVQARREAREAVKNYTNQLITAGERKDIAELVVKPFELKLLNYAKMLGISPKEVYDRINLVIQRGKEQEATRSLNSNGTDPRVRLSEEVAAWGATVDSLQGKPSQQVKMLGQTPLIMRMVGAQFEELWADPHLFDGMFPGNTKNPQHHEHLKMTAGVIKQIPAAITDPIMVYKDSRTGSTVFVLELRDEAGETVMAPVSFNATGKKGKINLLKTAFGRGDIHYEMLGRNNALLYVNRQKSRRWFPTSGADSLFDSNADGSTVLHEEDLVKQRNENPSLYQTQSTVLPTAATVNEGRSLDPRYNLLTLNFQDVLDRPDALARIVAGMEGIVGTKNALKDAKTDEEKAQALINWLKDNLRFVYDKMTPEQRARAKKWYVGGRKFVQKMRSTYKISDNQGAGVIAVLSPQRDWFSNLSLAERICDMVFGQGRLIKTEGEIADLITQYNVAKEGKIAESLNNNFRAPGERKEDIAALNEERKRINEQLTDEIRQLTTAKNRLVKAIPEGKAALKEARDANRPQVEIDAMKATIDRWDAERKALMETIKQKRTQRDEEDKARRKQIDDLKNIPLEVFQKRMEAAQQRVSEIEAQMEAIKASDLSAGEKQEKIDELKKDPAWQKRKAISSVSGSISAYEEQVAATERAFKYGTLENAFIAGDFMACAIIFRAIDYKTNSRSFNVMTPDGAAGGPRMADSGNGEAQITMPPFETLAKAFSILADGSDANINIQLGDMHKVRNFYNNLLDPMNPLFATIDTHAVAADTMTPTSSLHPYVQSNFGGLSVGEIGTIGTYVMHFEAYRQLSEELGILPRELQSITWEGIRVIFTKDFKGEAKNVEAIRKIWERVDNGEITESQAREEVFKAAMGNRELKMAWEDTPDDGTIGETYDRSKIKIDRTNDMYPRASMSVELAPNPDDAAAVDWWNGLGLSQDQQNILTLRVFEEIAPLLSKFVGTPVSMPSFQMGGFEGGVNPSVVISTMNPDKAVELARVVGWCLKQKSVWVMSDKPVDGLQANHAVIIQTPAGFTTQQLNDLYQKLYYLTDQKGNHYLSGFSFKDGNIVFGLDDEGIGITPEEVLANVKKILEAEAGDFIAHLAACSSGLVSTVEAPVREGENNGLQNSEESGRVQSETESQLRELRSSIESAVKRNVEQVKTARSENDLGRRPPVQDVSLGQSGVGYQSRGNGKPADSVQGQRAGFVGADGSLRTRALGTTVHYGTPREGAVSVIAAHYSKGQRSNISTAYYGSGYKGAESERLQGSANADIRPRSYFYAGEAVYPEDGVGAHLHSVILDNIYDLDKDELGIAKAAYAQARADGIKYTEDLRSDFNYVERAVMQAGFDGYVRGFGQQRAVVVLGKHAIPVQYHGTHVFEGTKSAKGVGVQTERVDNGSRGLNAVSKYYVPKALRDQWLADPNSGIKQEGSFLTFDERGMQLIQQYAPDAFKNITLLQSLGATPIDTADGELYQIAYHGSPFVFDRFSIDHIGTGTGKQTHGWGFYVALDKNIAEMYSQVAAEESGGERHLYSVEIPEDEVMLKLDAPFSEQPEYVKERINQIFDEYGELPPPDHWDGSQIYQSIILLEEGYGDEVPGDYEIDMDNGEIAGDAKRGSLKLKEYGIEGLRYDDFDDGPCAVIFSEEAIGIVDFLEQSQSAGRRGSIVPRNAANTGGVATVMTLMEKADRSTFLHESAHVWLDMDTILARDLADKVARGEELTDGEKYFLRTLGGFFQWGQREGLIDLGVTDDIQTVMAAAVQWSKMTVEQQRGMHELFAEGFESYIIDGNYPSEEVKGIFGRFASWLRDIYRNATKKPHPISPEVRKLYDQLFLSEQEAADAEVRAGLQPLFDIDDDGAPLDEQERAEYDRLKEQASMEAQGIIQKAIAGVMRRYTRLRLGTARKIRKQYKDRIAKRVEELRKEDRHVARDLLLKGIKGKKGERRTRVLLDENQLLKDGFSQETIDTLKKKGFVYQGERNVMPISPQSLTELTDYKNICRLMEDLVDIRDPMEEATEQIAAEVQMETGEKPDAYTELQSDIAAHNGTRTRMLMAEYNAIARALGSRSMLAMAASEYAAKKIGTMTIDDADPRIFINAEKRFAKMAEKAYRAGDFAACLEAKRGQIINHEMAKHALLAQQAHLKAQRAVKNAIKSKTTYKPYQRLLALIADRHGVAVMPEKMRKQIKGDNAEKILEELMDDGTPVDGLEQVLADERLWREMTVDEANDLFATLVELATVARNRTKADKLATQLRINEIVAEGEELLMRRANEKGVKPKFTEEPKTEKEMKIYERMKFVTNHIKIATWCRIFDGNKEGFFWNLFIRSANRCADMEETMQASAGNKLYQILKPVFGNKPAFEQGVMRIGNKMMSKGERVAAALNMGNDSNMQRLIEGDPNQWAKDAIDELTASLSAEDWKAVQAIWDLFESFRPMIAQKQRRVYGEEPVWIEPKPMEVTTSDGQKISLRGGYYPVKYDRVASSRAQRMDDVEAAKNELRGAFQSSTTNRSFTKQRSKSPAGMKVRLNMDALFSGLTDVIHDLCWHEWLIETRRVLNGVNGRGSGIGDVIQKTYGAHVVDAFNDWRVDIAQGNRTAGDASMWLRKLTSNIGVMTMGWSVYSAVAQLTGIGYIIPRAGVTATMKAIKTYITSPVETRRKINAASAMMRNRSMTINKEVAEIKGRLQQRPNFLKDHAYCMIVAIQSVVDSIAWQAAYEKAVSEGKTGVDAKDVADQAVIDTQSSGRTNDMSAVERDPGFRAFTIFYSWANSALNQLYYTIKGEDNRAKMVADIVFMAVVMPVIDKLFRECLKAEGDDDDNDDEDPALKAARFVGASTAEFCAGLFVFSREIANTIGAVIEGTKPFSYSGPAGTKAIDAAANIVGAATDPTSARFANAVADVLGAKFGLPTVATRRVIKAGQAYAEGDIEAEQLPQAALFGTK